jgi:hypothetical protein
MSDTPEGQARKNIDRQFDACGWKVQGRKSADHLPDSNVIAEEIVEDLQAALDQSAAMSADLHADE